MITSPWTFPALQKWAGWFLLTWTAYTLVQSIAEQQWRQVFGCTLATLFWFWGLKNGYAREARERQAAEADSCP